MPAAQGRLASVVETVATHLLTCSLTGGCTLLLPVRLVWNGQSVRLNSLPFLDPAPMLRFLIHAAQPRVKTPLLAPLEQMSPDWLFHRLVERLHLDSLTEGALLL